MTAEVAQHWEGQGREVSKCLSLRHGVAVEGADEGGTFEQFSWESVMPAEGIEYSLDDRGVIGDVGKSIQS